LVAVEKGFAQGDFSVVDAGHAPEDGAAGDGWSPVQSIEPDGDHSCRPGRASWAPRSSASERRADAAASNEEKKNGRQAGFLLMRESERVRSERS
jgi:hypothetical protein